MNRVVVVFAGLAVAAGLGGWWFYSSFMNRSLVDLSEEGEAERAAQVAAQDEDAFDQPPVRPRLTPQETVARNLYFGDLHVHTNLSFDAYLFGTRLSPEDAYRFANGEAVRNSAGEVMQIGRPLDFVALTDHAESFGLFETCALEDVSPDVRSYCDQFDRPSISFFMRLRMEGEQRPPQRPKDLCAEHDCIGPAKTTWSKIVAAADAHNRPGEFTTFAAYEYSPPLPDRGKLHRNVIFRGSAVPDFAVSAFEAPTVLDLWRSLDDTCVGECDVLTIPHNMNKTWGLAYADVTIDGDPYTRDDWALRRDSEPLAEIMQIKGASECAVGVGTTDEECNFEQYFPPCAEGQTSS